MQEKSNSFENFLDRFNRAVVQSGLSLVKFCKKAGIARSLYYEIRDGNRAVSDKVWRKLEAVEASICLETEKGNFVPRGTKLKGCGAENSANPNESEKGAQKFFGTREDEFHRQMAEMTARIQEALSAAFTMKELQTRMENAGAWPPSAADRNLTPGQLWGKYAPK